eukprot:1195789-Prorocentrum_minimum.AAC.2
MLGGPLAPAEQHEQVGGDEPAGRGVVRGVVREQHEQVGGDEPAGRCGPSRCQHEAILHQAAAIVPQRLLHHGEHLGGQVQELHVLPPPLLLHIWRGSGGGQEGVRRESGTKAARPPEPRTLSECTPSTPPLHPLAPGGRPLGRCTRPPWPRTLSEWIPTRAGARPHLSLPHCRGGRSGARSLGSQAACPCGCRCLCRTPPSARCSSAPPADGHATRVD